MGKKPRHDVNEKNPEPYRDYQAVAVDQKLN